MSAMSERVLGINWVNNAADRSRQLWLGKLRICKHYRIKRIAMNKGDPDLGPLPAASEFAQKI